MKRPAFQFYPADWRKDAALQSCSLAAQGLWVNAMCIAHECEPYGHLTVNGRPMTEAQIGRLVGISAKECAALLDELDAAGVLSRAEDGSIFSRRMVRDEDVRNRRAAGGQAGAEHGIKGAKDGIKGGRPREPRGDNKPPLEPPPSSSSSSSSSESTPLPPKGGERFDRFWSAYPRKVGKDAARKAFDKRKPDDSLLSSMLTAIDSQRRSEAWRKDGGQFIPHPSTWLNEGRWQDEGVSAAPEDAGESVEDYQARMARERAAFRAGVTKPPPEFRALAEKMRVA